MMATASMFGPVPQSVNFYQQSPEVATDLNALQRQRALALLLAQKGQETPQGQMVGGHFVAPGAASYVSQLANALGGAMMNRQADEREQSLAQALLTKRQQDAADFMKAANGTPAQAGRDIQPVTPNDDEGNPMPVARTDATPAVPGDMNRALAIALQSQNPQLTALAPEIMKRQLDAAELNQALAAAGITPPGGGSAPSGTGGGQFLVHPSGGVAGVNPQAVALTLSRSPQANKLGTMVQDASKPLNVTEGGTVAVQNPDGTYRAAFTAPKTEAGIGISNGQAGPIPGFAEAQARREGLQAQARQAAESQNTMVTIDTPQGPRMMTRAQALQLSNGQQPPVSGPVQPTPTNYTTRGGAEPPKDMRAAAQEQLMVMRGELDKMSPNDRDRPGLEREIARLETGLGNSSNSGGPGIALQTGEQKRFGESVASGSADALIQGRDKAKTAADSILSIRAARDAANSSAGTFQGSGAEAKLAIAKFINSNVPGITLDPEKVGNTDYMKSILGEGMLAQAKTLGANPSNADAQRITDIVGSIGKDPQAMGKLLDWREEMAQRTISNHNSLVKDAEGRGLKSPFDLTVKPPGARKSPTGKANIDDLLRKYR